MPIPIKADLNWNRGSWQARRKRKKVEGMLRATANSLELNEGDKRLWIQTPSVALLLKEVFLAMHATKVIRVLGPDMTAELIAMIDALADDYDPSYIPGGDKDTMQRFIDGEAVTDIRPKP